MVVASKSRPRPVNGEVEAALPSSGACPACKSDPKFNPGMRFKVSSKCYHRICEGCVDRMFVTGTAPCPIQGCKMHLWKSDWRAQQFEDVQMERDVDTRKRVMRILDRQEDEFETKRAWDDFLEMREEFIMNIILMTDVAATNRKLKAYSEANAPANRRQIKAGESPDPSGLILGLKKVAAPPPNEVYDPFMGMPTTRDYYQLRDNYTSRYDRFKDDDQVIAGGFDFDQFWDESLLRAFAGLGTFIEDEMAEREQSRAPKRTLAASVDDVF